MVVRPRCVWFRPWDEVNVWWQWWCVGGKVEGRIDATESNWERRCHYWRGASLFWGDRGVILSDRIRDELG